jgi:hypothetical protein
MPAQPTTSTGFTLTQATKGGRLFVMYFGFFLAFLIVGRMSLNMFVAYWKATHPPAPPPPTVGFGKLPLLNFPIQTSQDKPASYKLETATGGFPAFGDRAKVFLMQRSTPSLLADEKAKALGQTYEFVFAPEIISNQIYKWTKTQPLLSTLELNINNNHFEMTTNYLSKPELLLNRQLPTAFEAVERVKAYLDSTELLPKDIATASGEVVYLKSLGGQLSTAVSASDADFIQVDLNRNPIDNVFRMYTPEGYTGVITGIIAGNLASKDSIVELRYNYNQPDYSQVHTYPLRSVQSAWQLIQSGQGYVAQKGKTDIAVVRTVSLGYYDDFEEQDYLQPIYVFEGDDGFLAFISALDPKYVQN